MPSLPPDNHNPYSNKDNFRHYLPRIGMYICTYTFKYQHKTPFNLFVFVFVFVFFSVDTKKVYDSDALYLRSSESIYGDYLEILTLFSKFFREFLGLILWLLLFTMCFVLLNIISCILIYSYYNNHAKYLSSKVTTGFQCWLTLFVTIYSYMWCCLLNR